MTNTAFETTEADLQIVLERFGKKPNEVALAALFEEHIAPNADRIEEAALQAKTTEDDEETLGFQTEAALEEIAEILKEEGQLPEVSRDSEGKLIQNEHPPI